VLDAAIVGLGRWGRTLVDSVRQSDRIRFIREVDPALAPESRLADALADPAVQAIVLATPHSLHPEQVVASAKAGKHVFCEKPLALRTAEARAMVAACRRAGVVLGVGHNRRFWPAMRELKRLVAEDRLGRVLHVEGHNSNENSNRVIGGWRTQPAESPGGGLTGAGLHVLDAFVSLCGPVRRVSARLTTHREGNPPLDTLCALYEFAGGTSGTLGTVRATPFYWRVHVFGTTGSAEVLGETDLVLRLSGRTPERITLEPQDSVRAELEAFADAAEGRAAYPILLDEMLATVAAFEATVRAADTGEAVEIDSASSENLGSL
jgi:predicted dehydrogenase